MLSNALSELALALVPWQKPQNLYKLFHNVINVSNTFKDTKVQKYGSNVHIEGKTTILHHTSK
jgi:hypothetical protein